MMEIKAKNSEWEKQLKKLEMEEQDSEIVLDPVKDKAFMEEWGVSSDLDPEADLKEEKE